MSYIAIAPHFTKISGSIALTVLLEYMDTRKRKDKCSLKKVWRSSCAMSLNGSY